MVGGSGLLLVSSYIWINPLLPQQLAGISQILPFFTCIFAWISCLALSCFPQRPKKLYLSTNENTQSQCTGSHSTRSCVNASNLIFQTPESMWSSYYAHFTGEETETVMLNFLSTYSSDLHLYLPSSRKISIYALKLDAKKPT